MRTAKDLMLNTPKSFRKILRSALYANLSQVSTPSLVVALRVRIITLVCFTTCGSS